MMKAFFWSMGELADMVAQRQKNEFDVIIAVDGFRGNGKSTFVYKLFTRLGRTCDWLKFNQETDIMFDRDSVMDAMKNKKYTLIDADEMINSAHNRDFFSGDQKDFIKMMNMYRDNHNILAGSVPNFYDLDPQVRKLIKMRVTVIKRGMAVVQMAKNSLYTNDPWQTDINRKIEMSWMNKWIKGQRASPKYHRLTTFAGYISYGKLNPEQEIIYKNIKRTKRQLMEDRSIAINNPNKTDWWFEVDKLIDDKKIKNNQELYYYLMGKGIKYSTGISKINLHRKDEGKLSLRFTFKEDLNSTNSQDAKSSYHLVTTNEKNLIDPSECPQ